MRAEGRSIRWRSPSFSPLGLSSASHPLRNARRENSIFAVVIGLVTTWTGYIRSAGLDPHSLWHDDLWVAAVVKVDSLFEAVSLQVPAPPAFIGALWFSKRLVPDPELSLQLVPYCASLAVIPLLAIVVATISGSRALGVVAGSLMALSPDVAYYSVFVKQYTVDVLAIAGLLLIAVCFFRSREVRYLRLGAGLSIVSLLFSFPSVFAGVVFVNLAALMHVLSNDPAQGRADPTIRTALAFNLVLGRFGRLGQDLTRANRHQAVGGFTRPHEGGRAVVGPFTESQFVVPDHGVERLNSLLRQLDLWLRVGGSRNDHREPHHRGDQDHRTATANHERRSEASTSST